MAVNESNGRWEYTLTVIWNGETITSTSGVLSQSNSNGDHVYRFYLEFVDVERDCTHVITG